LNSQAGQAGLSFDDDSDVDPDTDELCPEDWRTIVEDILHEQAADQDRKPAAQVKRNVQEVIVETVDEDSDADEYEYVDDVEDEGDKDVDYRETEKRALDPADLGNDPRGIDHGADESELIGNDVLNQAHDDNYETVTIQWCYKKERIAPPETVPLEVALERLAKGLELDKWQVPTDLELDAVQAPHLVARLYGTVLGFWILLGYTMYELWKEWWEVLVLRRVYYLEAPVWDERRDELLQHVVTVQPVARDLWIPHPSVRDTVPNIQLYSELVGNLPHLPSHTDICIRQSVDWQLQLTAAFFRSLHSQSTQL